MLWMLGTLIGSYGRPEDTTPPKRTVTFTTPVPKVAGEMHITCVSSMCFVIAFKAPK
jgi:hypothetical protein